MGPVSAEEGKEVEEMDGGDGCTMWIYSMSQNCTLKKLKCSVMLYIFTPHTKKICQNMHQDFLFETTDDMYTVI